jgi:hypothetical protein
MPMKMIKSFCYRSCERAVSPRQGSAQKVHEWDVPLFPLFPSGTSPFFPLFPFLLRRSVAKLINRKTGRIETAQEWLGHTSTAHTRAYIDAEDYREKANGVVAGLDI